MSIVKAKEKTDAGHLVKLRGRALKNYEAAYQRARSPGSLHHSPVSDRRDPVLDREVDEFRHTVKFIHFHDLVLVEFDAPLGNRKFKTQSASNCKTSRCRSMSDFGPLERS